MRRDIQLSIHGENEHYFSYIYHIVLGTEPFSIMVAFCNSLIVHAMNNHRAISFHTLFLKPL